MLTKLILQCRKGRGGLGRKGSVWRKILRGHVWIVPGTCLSNLKSIALIVLEPLLTGQLRTDTDTDTHRSNIHSVHLAEINM